MATAHEILDLDNATGEDEINGSILRAKNSVITTAMSTQAKVEQTMLRRQQLDRMPELLKLAEEVRASLPPMIELRPSADSPPPSQSSP